MANLLRRLVVALAAHAFFVIIGTVLLVVASIIAKIQTVNVLSAVLVSIFVLIPWIIIIIVPVTVPSTVCSFLIYLIGGFFHERIALAVAIIVGAAVMFVALGGSYPADMKFPFSTTWKIALTAIYIMCWIAIRRILPKFI